MLGWIHWRKVTLGLSKTPKEDMQIAYDYAFESMQENPEWAPSMTLVGLIELFSGKHDVACARIPKLLEVSKTSFFYFVNYSFFLM